MCTHTQAVLEPTLEKGAASEIPIRPLRHQGLQRLLVWSSLDHDKSRICIIHMFAL